MEEFEKRGRDEIFSKSVRAGKRTYFFDVKLTRGDEKYITITESKKRFDNDQGKFFYEKHKIFLYQEDFEKFMEGLKDSVNFIETGEIPEDYVTNSNEEKSFSDIDFDDLENSTNHNSNSL